MKQKEISLNSLLIDTDRFLLTDEEIGDNHVATSIETPMREDAFVLSDEEKIKKIESHFKEIMYIEQIFSGLNPANEPQVALFENKFGYNEMLVEKNISFYSNCEHHFVPIMGKTHIAYISSGQVIGLSKLNRIVQYYAKRPQVQERLTMQIAKHLQKVLKTDHVAIFIDAKHLCVSSRGVKDDATSTITSYYGGKFQEENTKREFLSSIQG